MLKNGWLLALASATMLAAGLPPLNWLPLSCLGLVPLFLMAFDTHYRLFHLIRAALVCSIIYFSTA